MIRINTVKPINKNRAISLSVIQRAYPYIFKQNGKSPKDLLQNTLNGKNKRKNKNTFVCKNQIQRDIINYCKKKFETIISADVETLINIIIDFDNKKWNAEIKKDKDFKEELLFDFGYDERFRKNKNRGIWLAEKLNIKSCPYCNAQYTILIKFSQKQSIARFQFDHFFPKKKYPYLSVSLYNLIPSCSNCNLIKGDNDDNMHLRYHPYLDDINKQAKFYLSYQPIPSLLTLKGLKEQSLQINFIPKYNVKNKAIESHNELFHIDSIYDRHKDIAGELLEKAIVYNSAKKHYLAIKTLFENEKDFERYLIGSYLDKELILKRPFTKFKQDIAKQLKLIK